MNPGRKQVIGLIVAMATAAVAGAFMHSAPARAELTVEITEGVSDPIPIAIVPFGWSGVDGAPMDVAAVVSSDLQRSGRFRPMARNDMVDLPTRAGDVVPDDWRMLRNDFVVVGELQPQAQGQYVIRFALVNVLNGQKLLEFEQPAASATTQPATTARGESKDLVIVQIEWHPVSVKAAARQ